MNLKKLAYEPSTYRGVVWILTACGVALSPDQQTAVIALGMAIAGLIGAFLPDQPKDITAQGAHETTGPDRDQPVSAQHVQQLRETAGWPTRDQAARPNDGFNNR